MRLDRFVCKSTRLGKCEAIRRIHSGEVSVNGLVVTSESKQVHEDNAILLNGVTLQARDFRYIIMHKPFGTICSNIDEAYPSLFNYVDVENSSELHIVGRLDADTTGMVLITDDGRWSFDITRPTRHCPKLYRVGLSRPIQGGVAEQFAQGFKLQGEQQRTLPAQMEVIGSNEVLLTITEGKFHQVKRMFAAIGNRVVSLHRESIGEVSLDLDVGQWRYLTGREIASFRN